MVPSSSRLVRPLFSCSAIHSPIRFGRNNFQESMKIAHRMDHDKIDWNSFRFMVFDIPTSKKDYNQRYQQLRMASQKRDTFALFISVIYK